MKYTEKMLLDGYDGLCNGGSYLSIIDGVKRWWEYRRGNWEDGYNPVTNRDKATEITINDMGYILTTIDLDSDCDNHPALSRIKEDEDRVYYGILPTLTCTRCGHTWIPRSNKLPDVCPNPKCKSPYWNKPRKVK